MVVLLFMSTCVACQQPHAEPQVPSAAGQVAYAQDYPMALQSLANDQANAEGQIKSVVGEMPKYPDQLKDPPWDQVRAIVDAADEAGRSAAYAERERQVQDVQDFFTNEKEEIVRRVSGSVQYACKKKTPNCDLEPSGAVSSALKDSVERQLEKRLRASSDGQLLIERHHDSLGKANVAALEKQADAISMTAYLAYVALPTARYRAEKLAAEADRVKSTLDKAVADEQALQAEPGRSASEKKASGERLTRLSDSRSRIDARVTDIKTMLEKREQHDAAVQKEYDDALNALRDALSTKAKAEPSKKK